MRTLNLGILAHVDAGKTSLTERLLFAAGVIDTIGRVDHGNTQTDSLALEQQRGITIKSAVVSFVVDDVTVNLIDTPGHPDFIAEVERVLHVLDGAVLVVSAVEGVQSQTRILMRALQRLGIPTVIFVNKTDRRGADGGRVLEEIAARLSADALPVFFGSAITGAGVDALMTALPEVLPATAGDAGAQVSATVFKVDRGPAGEKVAYVRVFAGTLRVRDRVQLGDGQNTVTAIRVFERGPAVRRPAVAAGQIAKVWGLRDARIGDTIGAEQVGASVHHFAPPTLETVVAPARAADKAALRVALDQLAEQDPLINVRQDDEREATFVSLYGEVQKEVIAETLRADFGVEVTFRETTTIYVERPGGVGTSLALLQDEANPWSATIGLRVEPGSIGSGIAFELAVDQRMVPTHIYKTVGAFVDAMTQYVRGALASGLHGWQVIDCVVTMNECNYYASDGPRKRIGATPRTVAADFRKLTPVVLRRALEHATTVVCEPMMHVRIEVPADALGAVLAAVARLGVVMDAPTVRGDLALIETRLPGARTQELRRQVPGLTGGEGVVEAEFAGYQPAGAPVVRG